MKILISTSSFGENDPALVERLRQDGHEVSLNLYKRTMSEDEIYTHISGKDGLIAGTEPLTARVLENAGNLRVISRCGAGVENIDAVAAKRLGIKIYNTPDAPVLAVAELTVALILNLLRKIKCMNDAICDGKWQKVTGNLLCGKTVGIVGFGRIGKKVAELLEHFGCEIIYTDPFTKDSIPGFERVSLKELLSSSNIVTMHASTKDKILGKDELGLMKKGAWLINVSRGGAVDEEALYAALKDGRLSGAALDVFKDEPYSGPLKKLDNVILTPHIGSYAKEARVEMELQAVKNLLKGLEE